MDRVKFKVNGEEHTVGCEVSSSVSLLEYLRRWLELRGTKYMCQEAGCGACIVSAVKAPGAAPEAVNACMVMVTSCHGWEVTTIEKVGNRLAGYHPLQSALADTNGSQCGYCSPGWVMAMYSLLKKKKMTMLEIEQSLASNICRCTGYRPILDAFKKFGTDYPQPEIPDIEDLRICSKGETCASSCDNYDWCVLSKDELRKPTVLHIKLQDNKDWYKVEDITDIFQILNLHGTDSYMLIAGNTAKGAYPIDDYPQLLIDVSSVSALKGCYLQQNLVIGAGTTLTELMDIFDRMSYNDDFRYLAVLNEHLKLVAHIPVKNIGTIAGNLMIKNQHNEFNSDIFLLLNTVGADIGVLNASGVVTRMSPEKFLTEDMNGKVLLNILLPPLNCDIVKIVTYKIMPRSQNAHAIVHAGFLYEMQQGTVSQCRLAFGGLSIHFLCAHNTEDYLLGRQLFHNDTLQGAVSTLDKELVVEENPPEMSSEYRRQLALALFYKGLLSLCPPEILGKEYKSGSVRLRDSRGLSYGTQDFNTNPYFWPLNQPTPKFDALIQCAGEAQYSEDIPSLAKEVFAAFVLATVGLGTIGHIDPSIALKEPGVVAFYSASDIPGLNSFTSAGTILYTANEEVLCEKDVKYYNQALGIIVAESQHIADKAAKLVKVTYTNVRKPVFDIKLAKRDPKRTTLFTSSRATRKGDDVAKVINGEMSIYSQYHFCMETLVCVAHPIEEGIKLYAATQWIDVVHRMVSKVLNIPQNKVEIYLRRLGGAYGLKVSRATQVAVACALVTYKLNRPCRFIQSLTSNMRHVGKRFPCSIDFQIAVNREGVIQYNNYELFEDNGYIVDEPITMLGADHFNNVYDKSHWDYKMYDVITDAPSHTWCRSPSTFETIAMAEWLMERISYEVDEDPLRVRLNNLDTQKHKEIIELVNTLNQNSQYEERKQAVRIFNSENRWKKRGIRHSFMRWTPFGSLYLNINLSVYVGDGTVVLTHGGVEMGQGVNTKAAQICAYFLNIPVEKVQVKANDTTISPNCYGSGGSITSQFVGVGVQKCCEKLLNKLKPIRYKLGNPSWEELIEAAGKEQIDLQTHSMTGMADIQEYDIYGVTCAEVEIDVLTGAWNIVRVDLMEDVGRSVNPDIDVGQVEGAFMMGCGYWTCEELKFREDTGELLTDRTWHYWVPQARDIPQDFRVYFRPKGYSTDYILGSKATGEPATCMGVVVPIAMREGIVDARRHSGLPSTHWFDIDGPYTVEKICLACATKLEDFKFY